MKKIAYIMSRFPHLSETFILREMNELERRGWNLSLYPLILQDQSVVHAEAKPWLSRVRHTGYLSPAVLKANVQALFRQPKHYGGLWTQALWENRRSRNFFMRALALLPKSWEMARQMQEEGITHIHAHYATHPALMAWLIHHQTGIPYSITVHAHDIFVCHSMLETKLRDASFIAAISEFNRDYLADLVGEWVREKIRIVHCGVLPERYQKRKAASARSASCQLASGGSSQNGHPFEVISIGSLQPYKGHPYLIQACAELKERGVPIHCRVIGGGDDRAGLEKMIAEKSVGDVIELLGPQSQDKVAALLPTAHCYVQPSIITPAGKMEGIPVSIMEALACELPVVATSLSGIPELVRDGETGLLVPPADATALADALATIYSTPQEAAQLAQAGRQLVMQEFNLPTNVAQLADIFSSL